MVEPKLVLWQRIRDFEIDGNDVELSFAARLANENGWSVLFARRVIDEYKRFLFLAMVAGHEVTPSDEVDQAWHLHLVYTRSYWEELCGKVLEKPLHHGPTVGGRAEAVRYDENYRRTLASYEKWFGEKPSAEIWPRPQIRFSAGDKHVRVNLARNWVVNKQFVARVAAAFGLFGLCLAGFGAAGANGAGGLLVMLVIILCISFLIVIVGIIKRDKRSGSDGSGYNSGCAGFWSGCSSACGTGGDSGCASSGCGGSGCGGGGCGGGGCGGSGG